ncbi:SMI1/KNR4 family protein [Allokutzneria oryzae]|uniref:SMI1/KNR4 family protein n=1 Tax=Allokutzneria oryzae TaxID=1378989 RepID=A0ABV6AAX0_9PSEU
MTHSVDSTWERIVAWLRTHTPVSAAHLGPPAVDKDIAVVEALLGRSLPTDLLAWWRHSCGVTGFVGSRVIPPRYAPYMVDEAVDCREGMLEAASCEDDAETAVLLAEPAGSPCTPYWLPLWLPIAHDGGGNYLFADLRSGPLTGCIMQWDEDEAAVTEPSWPSTAAMLAEIADALERGTDIEGYQPDARDDGTLDWV